MNLTIRIIKKIFNFLFFKLRNCIILKNIKSKYKYKNFSIYLPINHMLPDYQKANQKYDKLLPEISKLIKHDELVVDIGANVGDTLAAMVDENSDPTYLCIEPEDQFYSYLKKNVKLIKEKIPNLKVHLLKEFVGKEITDISLISKGGTAKTNFKKGTIKSVSLDSILKKFKIDNKIKLLKSDVDGFDYDVLESSMNTIEKYKPMIYFECFLETDNQYTCYKNTIRKLNSKGYFYWTVIDNFGQVIISTQNLEVIFQLMEYVWSQNQGKTKRTIYYYDFVACCDNDKDLVEKVITKYLSN